MDENELYARFWALLALVLICLMGCITAYNIADRIGPQRPIVTMTQQYQAK